MAQGDHWRNQWTAAELGLDPGGLGPLGRLPDSGDLVAARPNGDVVVLRIAGPDQRGRYEARLAATFRYPEVGLALTVARLTVDPTGRRGAERFALTLLPHRPDDPDAPAVLQELSYDADAARVTLASAPLLPGDLHNGRPWGYGVARYDQLGRLWAARSHVFNGGPLAVYTGPRCPYRPGRELSSYRLAVANGSEWGEACPPSYDLLQAQAMLAASGLVEDPAAGLMAMLGLHGSVMVVRTIGTGSSLTFEIDRLGQLCDALLAYARAEVTAADQFRVVDVSSVVNNRVTAWRTSADRAGITLVRTGSSPVAVRVTARARTRRWTRCSAMR